MYINELSLLENNLSKYDLQRIMTTFCELFITYYKMTKSKKLYLHNDYIFDFIYNSFNISTWLNDPTVDIEEKRLISAINQHIERFNGIDEVELIIFDNDCKSGALAHLEDSVLLSLASNDRWIKNEFNGVYSYFDSDGELINQQIKIPNVAIKDHLSNNNISDILNKNLSESPSNYSELWERRDVFFPSLVFCNSVEDNLDDLDSRYYNQVLRKLNELEDYFSRYTGVFDKNELLNATQESEATLTEYRSQHEFFAPNGNRYLASWHIRFTGIAGRVFFEPHYESNKCLICYIGKKLPNKSYPT